MRTARQSPDPAAIQCRSGAMALKGNLHTIAAQSFREALTLNPLIWEAFEGLCALGNWLFASRQVHSDYFVVI
jgi:anaphase-promoting complex subunit 3